MRGFGNITGAGKDAEAAAGELLTEGVADSTETAAGNEHGFLGRLGAICHDGRDEKKIRSGCINVYEGN